MLKQGYKTQELIYYTGYILYMIAAAFLVNVYNPLSKLVKVLSILVMVGGCLYGIRQIRTGDIFRNLLVIGIIVMTALLLDFKLAVFFIFIYAFADCRFDTLIKLDFILRLSGFLATVLCCALGLAEDYVLKTYRSGGALVLRHSLGHAHPNSCFLMVFILLVDYLLLRALKKGRTDLLDTLAVFAFAVLIKEITDCRAGFALIVLFAILMYVQGRWRVCQKFPFIPKLLCCSAALCMVLSVVLMLLYRHVPAIGEPLNNVLTKRLSSMSYFFETYGVSLLPTVTQRVSTREAAETGARALVLDNLYANLLISFGLVFTAVYLYLQARIGKLLVKAKRYEYLLVFTILAVYGIVEGMALNLDYNYFLVLARFVLFPRTDPQLLAGAPRLSTERKLYE